jgi:hypothetical protein
MEAGWKGDGVGMEWGWSGDGGGMEGGWSGDGRECLPSIFTLYASPVNSYGREAGGGGCGMGAYLRFLRDFALLHLYISGFCVFKFLGVIHSQCNDPA